jgi:hypothetical protein
MQQYTLSSVSSMDCVISPYKPMDNGYCQVTVNKENWLHHRYVYCKHNNLSREQIKGKVVMHTCDNPVCVNPQHLVLGTTQDNIKDKVNKGRQTKGESVNTVKLTDIQVNDIRNSTEQTKKLSSFYNVHRTTIQRIRRGANWKHLFGE